MPIADNQKFNIFLWNCSATVKEIENPFALFESSHEETGQSSLNLFFMVEDSMRFDGIRNNEGFFPEDFF